MKIKFIYSRNPIVIVLQNFKNNYIWRHQFRISPVKQLNWTFQFEKHNSENENCARGEIGRHAILRGWCQQVCWFESSRAHKKKKRIASAIRFFFFPSHSFSNSHFYFMLFLLFNWENTEWFKSLNYQIFKATNHFFSRRKRRKALK